MQVLRCGSRFYFPLEHIVFSGVLASEMFPPRLGGEEGFKWAKPYGNSASRVYPPSPAVGVCPGNIFPATASTTARFCGFFATKMLRHLGSSLQLRLGSSLRCCSGVSKISTAERLVAAYEARGQQCMVSLSPQELSTTAWAFATVERSTPALFDAIAAAATSRVEEYDPRQLATTAWAFAKVKPRTRTATRDPTMRQPGAESGAGTTPG